jgi:hypothetical protein
MGNGKHFGINIQTDDPRRRPTRGLPSRRDTGAASNIQDAIIWLRRSAKQQVGSPHRWNRRNQVLFIKVCRGAANMPLRVLVHSVIPCFQTVQTAPSVT